MNFLLSDEQLALLDALRGLLQDKCDPRHVHEIFDGDGSYDAGLWQAICEMGIPAIMVPEELGGLGLKLIDLAIAAELVGEYAAPVPLFGHCAATIAVALCGSAAQRERWLPKLASGEALATLALGEGDSRWLPGEWEIAGEARLNGKKRFVPHGLEADLFIVGTASGLVLVEKGEGVAVERLDGADRTRSLDTVTFTDAPAEPMPGDEASVARSIDAASVLLAADAFGGANHCVEMSVEYAKVREQYGAPIGSFQGLKHQLSNMALAVEPGRGLYWYAAHAWDELPEKARHAAAQAKAHLTDIYLQATRDTVEAHGGIGFTWEHDTHIYMKRAMLDWAWLGQPEKHRLRAADLAGW